MGFDASPNNLNPYHRIIQRLTRMGIPAENLKQPDIDLVAYVKSNTFVIDELVSAILPPDEEVVEAITEGHEESEGSMFGSNVEDIYHESMIWLQWLMFEGDVSTSLEQLGDMNGQRGVCGAIWGNNDIAYRCRTCEHDPTCAICVSCFQNGNHKDHDYSIMYTGGGCCDCGDATAWKREGFCSKHRGAEQIEPLPEKFSSSMGPVLDSLLRIWNQKLLFAETISQESPQVDDRADELKNVADEFTSSVVEMLLEFCKQSESLLSFISQRVFLTVGLLDTLVRAERLLNDDVVRKLHELLLKFLSEPQFKYEFAKVFLSYYPAVVKDAVKENSDTVYKKFPLLSTFSVQILTVPTLTPRLVKEMDLLAILFDCLGEIFTSCAGENNKLQVNRWGNLYDTTIRVVEDIRFVFSHNEIPKYVTHDRRDILRSWMQLLSFVQGMNPQKRETDIHVEEEYENMHLQFVLCHSIANIHSLLVAGAFADSVDKDNQDEAMIICKQEFEDQDSLRHSKVGRLSEESSVSSTTGWTASDNVAKASETKYGYNPLPSSVVWLTFECLKALENWLRVDNTSRALVDVLSPKLSNSTANSLLTLRRTLSKFRREGGRSYDQEAASDDCRRDGMHTTEIEALQLLCFSDWPEIVFDVSSQEFSVHIPLHRLLSMILQQAFRMYFGESPTSTSSTSYAADPLPAGCQDFFGHILGGYHPYGFSAFLMEHPLRIRVFCAEVHAGMWRRNGDTVILSSEWYRSVRWTEQGLEFDLFLLQCCAALAPADLYVQRILERFGLSKYLSLNVERSNEYEPILVHEMLTLIIQIVKERRFSGFSTPESLRRELIYKLSIGNSPRSQLVKSLPLDLSKVENLQEILDDVADYSIPSGINQGMYKLKTQHWKGLDLYHPRWNPRDLQIAEERFLSFCNCSAFVNQLPKWSKIYHPLRGVACIATCKKTAQIIHAVLFYAVFSEKSTASRAPDGVVIAALHLLALALDVCYVQKKSDDHLCPVDDVIPVLAFAGEEGAMNRHGDHSMLYLLVLLLRMQQKQSVNNLTEASNYNISSLIENMLKKFAELDSKCMVKLRNLAPDVVSQVTEQGEKITHFESGADKNKAKARERQAAMLEKMKAQQSKFLASINSSIDDDLDEKELEKDTSCSDVGNGPEESSQVICSLCHDPTSRSPLSYLVLLQKSRLLSFIDRAPPTWDQGCRSEKELASTSSNIVEVSPPSKNKSQSSEVLSPKMCHLMQLAVNQFAAQAQPGEVKAILEYINSQFPSLNMYAYLKAKTETSVEILEEDIHTMVREEMHKCLQSADFSEKLEELPYVRDSEGIDFDTDSLFLAKYIASLAKETVEDASGSNNTDRSSQFEGNMLPPECDGTGPYDSDGIHLTSCGHAVHQECLDRYLLSLKERHMRRIVFEGGNVADPDQGEFLCPVCRGLSNSVLPASSLKSDNILVTRQLDAVGSSSFLNGGGISLQLQEALCLLRSAAKVAGRNDVVRYFLVQCPGERKLNLDPVFRVLSGMYVRCKDKLTGSCRLRQSPLMLWDTLKYSLISTELASRSRKSSLAPNYSLRALNKDLKSSNCFILSLLLDIVQRVRTTNPLNSLLRLKGIQHFSQSICSSVTLDRIPEPGYVQQIVEKCGTEIQRIDIRLWSRASDPIIARDPFSSLMWILFCLPSPFMMDDESFLSLVHLFYVVTITQAAITYNRKRGWCTTDIGYQDCVFADISKFMAEYEVGMQYFESNYIDSFKDMNDSIRRLSFPYLRKCALLWKLIKSSQPEPFSDGTQVTIESIRMGDDSTEFANNAGEDLVEIKKLEMIFKIPSLHVVSEDGLLRSVVRGWLHHFSKGLEARCLPPALYVTPVVPLQLMLLPRVYQDLLPRYIKHRCPDCGLVQADPALCLICGKLCSSVRKPCCRERGCQTHALSCGAGIGVFLLIRKTTVLLQRSGRQALWPSPYLDSFGEEDIDFYRGKPLYLNEERYAALTHMVSSHGIDRSSRVLLQTNIGRVFII
ncbi:ubiquitin-protein ligase [Lithospermum erythrorhizon]|uniref:E3 ubiquitin-protein ligase n=1 Tax=Lithospermum erythrorhizon TaxID=34254 RepID=A0AAV3QKM7_LITER